MAKRYLGLPFDIHGGGLENIFPHNESEVAQCEAAYGSEFARYWVLNNMVTVNGTKMGKSLGNFTTIKDALKKHGPMTVRLFILSSHYRSNTDFSDAALEAAGKGYQRLVGAVALVRSKIGQAPDEGGAEATAADGTFLQALEAHKARFLAAMDDDLNTPQALAVLFDLGKLVNTLLNTGGPVGVETLVAIDQQYRALGGDILGLIPDELPEGPGAGMEDPLMDLVIELRANARKNRDWNTADMIRDWLCRIGIVLEDRPEGTTWRLNR
jgi:cysteinyl-tRNA synthetase